MTKRKRLPLADPSRSSLGLPTVMDRDLAGTYGVDYVHLAVFAIDIDRVYWLDPEAADLPFAWEVFLTEYYVLARTAQPSAASQELLEAVCTSLLEETPGEPPLGGQIVFAVYDAVERGLLRELAPLFQNWRNPPEDLVAQLATLHVQSGVMAQRLADHCLQAELEPPLAPPTRQTLERIRSGELQVIANV
jgi:hypothetical protein